MVANKFYCLEHGIHEHTGARDDMFHRRRKFLTQLNCHFVEPFFSLIQLCFDSVVLNVKFLDNTCAFLESSISFFLLLAQHINIASQGEKNLRRTSTIKTHLCKFWSQDFRTAKFFKSLKKH